MLGGDRDRLPTRSRARLAPARTPRSSDEMTLEDFCAHCLALPGAEETTPFGPEVIVFKVSGKMFATAAPDELPYRVNLKCDPDRALELRDRYEDIIPGYHMNKRHWNTLTLSSRLPNALTLELIHHSYALVVASLTKRDREALSALSAKNL
jgi:predicted DNA-binding protein (MmcQ/YjbR family)